MATSAAPWYRRFFHTCFQDTPPVATLRRLEAQPLGITSAGVMRRG